MKCPKCGAENPPGRVLCTKCGTRLRITAATIGGAPATPEATAVMMQRLRGDIRKLVVVFVVVIAVMAALGIFLR
ncbi:MAG: zinc ribbon domain-containing protein [Armatimonadota bacterium]|nr:zinc ribbon domain-containing protein [Armatimonadota bacterium]